jgi:hypothetical protein
MRSLPDALAKRIGERTQSWSRASLLRLALVLAGRALTATSVLALPGCITAMVIVASSMRPSPQSEFEAHADGRLYAPYVDACYWRRQYDPAQSLCGRMIESRETPEGVEYVHGPYGQCVYSFIVDKNTQLITSWRYVSAPESCWTQPSSE